MCSINVTTCTLLGLRKKEGNFEFALEAFLRDQTQSTLRSTQLFVFRDPPYKKHPYIACHIKSASSLPLQLACLWSCMSNLYTQREIKSCFAKLSTDPQDNWPIPKKKALVPFPYLIEDWKTYSEKHYWLHDLEKRFVFLEVCYSFMHFLWKVSRDLNSYSTFLLSQPVIRCLILIASSSWVDIELVYPPVHSTCSGEIFLWLILSLTNIRNITDIPRV